MSPVFEVRCDSCGIRKELVLAEPPERALPCMMCQGYMHRTWQAPSIGRGSSGGPGGGGGGSGAAASTEMSNKNVVAAAAEANAKKAAKDKAAAEALKPEPQTAKEKVLAELEKISRLPAASSYAQHRHRVCVRALELIAAAREASAQGQQSVPDDELSALLNMLSL